MKTTLDVDTAIYRLLNVPVITSLITGGIYKNKRPSDSVLEDVIINTITLSDGTRQLGASNVNIYVPDVKANISGMQHFLANTARLLTITNSIKPLLEEIDGEDYALWIEKTELSDEPEIKQHFMNIRLQIRMYNHK